jgi:choline dehydrogenase-like flavoprotein
MSNYDVIIIGSGAGGGTLASHLAPWGLLERLVARTEARQPLHVG